MPKGKKKSWGTKLISIIGFFVISLLIAVVLVIVGSYLPFYNLQFLRFLGQSKTQLRVKVVDQYSQPAVGYNIVVTEGRESLNPFVLGGIFESQWFTTDENGIFLYKSKGRARTIGIGDHRAEIERNEKFFPGESLRFSVAALKEMDIYSKSESHNIINNQITVKVVKLPPPGRLLFFQRKLALEDEKNYVCINVIEGKVWEAAEPQGDISMVKDNVSIKIFGKKGWGIIPIAKDSFEIMPPEEGYRGNIVWKKDFNPTKDVYDLLKFYFHSETENIYGKIESGGGWKYQKWYCYANLEGERNLYYKGFRDEKLYGRDVLKIQDYISPPVSLPLEKPSEAKPSEAK
jgi:hypothetical protein